jgi:hypothetical protein
LDGIGRVDVNAGADDDAAEDDNGKQAVSKQREQHGATGPIATSGS